MIFKKIYRSCRVQVYTRPTNPYATPINFAGGRSICMGNEHFAWGMNVWLEKLHGWDGTWIWRIYGHVVYVDTHNLKKKLPIVIVLVLVLVLFGCYRWCIIGGAVVVQWWCSILGGVKLWFNICCWCSGGVVVVWRFGSGLWWWCGCCWWSCCVGGVVL